MDRRRIPADSVENDPQQTSGVQCNRLTSKLDLLSGTECNSIS
jgi:hypothetical protein